MAKHCACGERKKKIHGADISKTCCKNNNKSIIQIKKIPTSFKKRAKTTITKFPPLTTCNKQDNAKGLTKGSAKICMMKIQDKRLKGISLALELAHTHLLPTHPTPRRHLKKGHKNFSVQPWPPSRRGTGAPAVHPEGHGNARVRTKPLGGGRGGRGN